VELEAILAEFYARRTGEGGRMAGWLGRRVVRAELRDHDMVSSTGASVVRYGQYLGEGRGGRIFWLVASVTQLAVFVGLPFVLVWSVWDRSDLDRADPARMGLMLSVALVSWWCALVWQSSVRAMARSLLSSTRLHDEGEGGDDS
jgi:hypothetical protein